MNTIISAEIFNSLCKICKEHGWYMPEENFRKVYKNIEDVLIQVEEHIKEVNDYIGVKGKMNKKLRNLKGDF